MFDSSGPEGKVRGTPQQIIDKYLALARDAQLGNDRVAEQNFLQHAEHYTRMLGEAQREMAREQEERQRNFPQQAGNGGAQGGQSGNQGNQGGNRDRADRPEREPRADEGTAMPEAFATEDDGPGLVVTPEMQAESAPVPAAPAPQVEEAAEEGAEPAPKKPRSRSSSSSRSRSTSSRSKKSDKAEGQGDAAPAEAPAAPTGD